MLDSDICGLMQSPAQQDFPVKVREQKDGRLIANFQGTSRLIFGQEEAMGLRLQLDGKTVVLPNIFDPRCLCACSRYLRAIEVKGWARFGAVDRHAVV